MDKNAVSLIRTNSHCKGEVVVHVKQKFPLLYPYFYPCPIALWTSLQLENMSTIEMNTDWKTLSKVKCIYISCKKCLALDVSAIEKSVLGGNVIWDLKIMSTVVRCLL